MPQVAAGVEKSCVARAVPVPQSEAFHIKLPYLIDMSTIHRQEQTSSRTDIPRFPLVSWAHAYTFDHSIQCAEFLSNVKCPGVRRRSLRNRGRFRNFTVRSSCPVFRCRRRRLPHDIIGRAGRDVESRRLAEVDVAVRPNASAHVAGACGEVAAGGAGGDRDDGILVALEEQLSGTGSRIPELDAPVLRTGHDPGGIWREGDGENKVL